MRAPSELILNADGSIYHLNLHPQDIADTIITVGDPHRVHKISRHFDEIEVQKEKREFVTHTGRIGQKRLTVISTGIGAGNIDIVLNELDALTNIDLQSGQPHSELKKLHVVRIGTSGSIHPDIAADDILMSQAAIGLDGVLPFYGLKRSEAFDIFLHEMQLSDLPHYLTHCGTCPFHVPEDWKKGVTLSSPGFYAPQGRALRLSIAVRLPLNHMHQFILDHNPMTNIEMETAPIFGLCALLGHEATSVNVILANRHHKTFSQRPVQRMDEAIEQVLTALAME